MNRETNNIWYQRPAERWKECMPVGSGRLGGMIYGNVSEERICLNEESIWAGKQQDTNNPRAQEALPKLRRLIFEGQVAEAEKMAKECFVSVPPKFGAYQPYAELVIEESDVVAAGKDVPIKYCEYRNYRRSLNLCQGIARVKYEKNGICFQREYFASHVDNVIVVHYTNTRKAAMDYKVQFTKDSDNCYQIYSDDAVYYEDQLEDGGIRYCGVAKVAVENGKGETNRWASEMGFMEPALDIVQADTFTVYIAITTNFGNKDEHECFRQVELAAEKGYERVKADHVRDFSELYQRFSLELESPERETGPVPQWLDEVRRGQITPAFTELYMNYTRYLLISASRKGELPSNLQGVWNEKKRPSCECDYHTNINLQMNYWPAQAWGLGECEETLVSWLENLAVTGKLAVQKNYGASGWTVHHCTDIFGYAAPNFHIVDLWPMGGPWMCRHLYEMWQYQGDYEIMRDRLFPLVEGSVAFVLDFLVEAPEGSACPKMLVTNPSVSPENEYLLPDDTENGGILFEIYDSEKGELDLDVSSALRKRYEKREILELLQAEKHLETAGQTLVSQLWAEHPASRSGSG